MEILKKLISQVRPGRVKKVCVGTFTTAVISHQCGLASTLRVLCDEEGHLPVRNSGNLEGSRIKNLAEYVLSDNILEASIGMATINSALPLMKIKYTELNASELVLQQGANKIVAIIGHFPFVKALQDRVKKLYIFEKHLRPKDISAEKIPDLLPEADVVAITGTSLMNHTLMNILKYCKPSSYKIMLGPSTPLSPVLFEYGINAISGTLVHNVELLLNSLNQGATFRQLKGKTLVTMKRSDH
ncbi:MAG: DUF364 domain-containing protein [Spirochaetes bacterium]|nr:DUF364 domain-containing protein [Spirochaetota bacterium]